MTSNNVKDLPPELTRAGRLDCIWYFNLPDKEERKEIFDLHFKKRGHEISDSILNQIAKDTNKYTGAEIEQIVISAIRKAYIKMKKDNLDNFEISINDLKEAKENVIPVAISSKEMINELEHWVKGRALYSSKENKKTSLEDKLEDIDLDELLI